jgi:MFS transporter, YNFM family, putative membrane transport protein
VVTFTLYSPKSMFSRRGLAVVAAGITAFLNIYGLQTLLPTLADSLQASSQEVSLTISATTLAVALFSPWAGLVAARLPRKRQVGIAVAGLTLCGVAGALAPDLGSLLVARFLLGMFLPLLVTAVMGMIAEEWTGPDLGRGTSLYIASTVFGGFFGRFLTGVLGAAVGWRSAVLALALANAGAGIFLLSQMPERAPTKQGVGLRDFLAAWRVPGVPLVLLLGFQVLFCLVGLFSYIGFYLAQSPFRLGPAGLGSLSCVYLVGGAVTPFAGRLFHRFGFGHCIQTASAVGAAGVLLTLVGRLDAVVVGLILCSTATFICQSAATGWVSQNCREWRSAAMGLYLSAYYFGGCCGAAVPGFFWNAGGWWGCVLLFGGSLLFIRHLAGRLPRS